MTYFKNLAIAEGDIQEIIDTYEEVKHLTEPDQTLPKGITLDKSTLLGLRRAQEASASDYQRTVRDCVKGLVAYLDEMSYEDIIPLIVGHYVARNEDLGELFQLISQECIRRRDEKINRRF